MPKRIYNQTTLFGDLYAYLVVLSPPKEINQQLAGIKLRLDAISTIGDRNVKSLGHITLADRLTDEADFENTVEKRIVGKGPFDITLSGTGIFDHGPDKKTVYLNVTPHGPILDLMQRVNVKSGFPHLTLAKNISGETLDALKPSLSELNYEASWTCDEILVLKKPMPLKHLGFRPALRIPLL